MTTYTFVVYDKLGKYQFVEVNAETVEEAYSEMLKLPIDITYIDLIP